MKNKNRPAYSNILIRVPNWLGDSMMATPAVAAAREMFPRARLTVLSKRVFMGFWKGFPGVDQVLPLRKGFLGFWRTSSEIRKQNFDAALILPTSFSSAFLAFSAGIPERIGWGGEGRSAFLTRIPSHSHPRQKHLVLEYLELAKEGFGVPLRAGKNVKLRAAVTAEAEKGLRQVWDDAGVPSARGFIALSPGATYGAAKRWPLPYWKELIAKILKERKEHLLLLGGLEEEAYLKPLLEEGFSAKDPQRIHLLAGRTTPSILAAMLSRCKILVTNDTGPMHVAAAVGTPTVALFGSTSPVWTRPFGVGHEVIYKHEECSPCFQRTCPIGYPCLHKISVEEVFRAVLKKLKGRVRIEGEKVPVELTR